jgi:hypothetical protein
VRSGRPTEQPGTLFDVETLFSNGAAPRGSAGEQQGTAESIHLRVSTSLPTLGCPPRGWPLQSVDLRVEAQGDGLRRSPRGVTPKDHRSDGRHAGMQSVQTSCSRQDEPAREASRRRIRSARAAARSRTARDQAARQGNGGATRPQTSRLGARDAAGHEPAGAASWSAAGRASLGKDGRPRRSPRLRAAGTSRVRDAGMPRVCSNGFARTASTGTSDAFMADEGGSHSVERPQGRRQADVLEQQDQAQGSNGP